MGDVSRGETDAAEVAVLFDRNRLRIARELRGLTQVQLARDVGSVTAASLSQFENGHSRPSSATIRRLAVTLRVPVAFFAVSVQPVGRTGGFFRSLRSTSPRDRQQALASAELVRALTLQLERHVALPETDLPRSPRFVTEDATREEIESLAEDVRHRWNIPSGPVVSVVRVMESHGVITARFHVGTERVDAFSVPYADRPIAVLGADKGLRDRSRFDAAHELGHLLMHNVAYAGSKVVETQANQFAAAFLMPEKDIISELPAHADWRQLLHLKAKWHVSIAALLMRAKTLGVMREDTYLQCVKTMSARGWRKNEPGDIGAPERPIILRRAVDVARDIGVELGNLICEAGLPGDDIFAILGESADQRPRVEI